jgi:ABC-type glutathione transport system ATPase component
VLVTAQDLPQVSSLADFVYVLDSGAVVGRGEPADVAADTRVQAAYLRFGPPDPAGGQAPEGPQAPEAPEEDA